MSINLGHATKCRISRAQQGIPHRYPGAQIYNEFELGHGIENKMVSAKENQLPSLAREIVTEKLTYANSTLPFLSVVVKEIDQLASEHRSIRTRLGEIDLHRHLDGKTDLYSDELKDVEVSADQLCDRLAECYREMDQIEGISFDAARPQFVDFPLESDFGLIHFCWKLGEPTVSHWHWSDEGCDARRAILGFEEITETSNSLLA